MALVKINIPLTEEEYISGNGEGVFAEIDDLTHDKYDDDVYDTSGDYNAILMNNSWNYYGLGIGNVVPIELRGTNRPVVKYDWLIEYYDKRDEDNDKIIVSIWDTLRGLQQFTQFSYYVDPRDTHRDENKIYFTTKTGREYELTLKEVEV